jgi:hypothetical protein
VSIDERALDLDDELFAVDVHDNLVDRRLDERDPALREVGV